MANDCPSNLPVYAIIGNIPHDYHSADLRKFFLHFIEANGFECFHFRHRPEGEIGEKDDPLSSAQSSCSKVKPRANRKTCCIVKLKEEKLNELLQLYHKKHWLDSKGKSIPSLCFISKIKIGSNVNTQLPLNEVRDFPDADPHPLSVEGMSRPSGGGQERLALTDVESLKELHPPAMMPNGNVGTATAVFLELIKACKLPPKIIGKLGLTFPKSQSRRIYGTMKLDYKNIHQRHRSRAQTTEVSADAGTSSTSASRRVSTEDAEPDAGSSHTETSKDAAEAGRPDAASRDDDNEEETESEEDVDDCEEWERHEALHDDPANYERNKERVYEEPLEVVWEKGGPGLVWYTDEKYWREQQGDFDEQTADDWDVDMSVYYDPNGGDFDSRQLVEMRREKRRRQGLKDDQDGPTKIGKFEQYTKGIGRKVLEKRGWTDGSGLGSGSGGIADALDNDGQAPTDKRGFGYYGEKINRYGKHCQPNRRKRRDPEDVIISTVYDNPSDLEIPETLLRRTDHNTMKYNAEKYKPSQGPR